MNKANWFLTNRGIMFNRGAVVVASSGMFAAYLGLHTIYLDKYREIVQFYSSGVEKGLTIELQELTSNVLKECRLKEREQNSIKFFTVCGFDTFRAGSTKLNTGGLVGLPNHFNYERPDDVEMHLIKLQNNAPVKWSTGAGQDLLDSLVLSRGAKKFALASEIYRCTTYYVYAYGLAASLGTFMAYLLGNGIAHRFNMYRLPRKFRFVLYSMCGTIGLFLFLTTKDALSQYWDRYSDNAAAKTSQEYLEGGIEYYEKILKRNKAMRTLLEKGDRYFTWHGNKKTFLRTTSLPPTARLDHLRTLKSSRDSLSEEANESA